MILLLLWSAATVAVLAVAGASAVAKAIGLPASVLHDAVAWGKLKSKTTQSSLTRLLNVPKRWFLHFYVLGAAFAVVLLALLVFVRCHRHRSSFTAWLSNPAVYSHTSMDATSGILCLVLMAIQCLRRSYECLYVHRFSPTAQMHILHYAVGLLFYPMVCLTILSEAHMWQDRECVYSVQAIGRYDLLVLALFAYASLVQGRCHAYLASLRPTPSASHDYPLPTHPYFNLVTCPHYTCEVAMYASVGLLCGGTPTMAALLAFVVCNLGIGAHLTRQWYRQRYVDFPRHRPRLIPFLF